MLPNSLTSPFEDDGVLNSVCRFVRRLVSVRVWAGEFDFFATGFRVPCSRRRGFVVGRRSS